MNVKQTVCDMCHVVLNPDEMADVGIYIDLEGEGGCSLTGEADEYRVHFCVSCCSVLRLAIDCYAPTAEEVEG